MKTLIDAPPRKNNARHLFTSTPLCPDTVSKWRAGVKSLGFFNYFQNTPFLLLYYLAPLKATATFFISGDRGCPSVRFEYEQHTFEKKIEKIENCVAFISANKNAAKAG